LLVLSRRINEKIIINGGTHDEVVIIVTDICRDKVRLGILAPAEISVNREEVEVSKANYGPDSPPLSRYSRRLPER
jgi:carbon storage regulator